MRVKLCFQITGKACGDCTLETQCSWEGYKLPENVKETSLSSALGELGVEERGVYKESGIRSAHDLKKKKILFLSVLGGKKKSNQASPT